VEEKHAYVCTVNEVSNCSDNDRNEKRGINVILQKVTRIRYTKMKIIRNTGKIAGRFCILF